MKEEDLELKLNKIIKEKIEEKELSTEDNDLFFELVKTHTLIELIYGKEKAKEFMERIKRKDFSPYNIYD